VIRHATNDATRLDARSVSWATLEAEGQLRVVQAQQWAALCCPRSGEELMNDAPVDVREAEVAALEAED
jgi:hypothetical protein